MLGMWFIVVCSIHRLSMLLVTVCPTVVYFMSLIRMLIVHLRVW